MPKDFSKDHILIVSIPKYDWSRIADEKKNKEKKEIAPIIEVD